MDSTNVPNDQTKYGVKKQRAIIFQLNPNVAPGTDSYNDNNYASSSAKQLGIVAGSADQSATVTITGFNKNDQGQYVGQLSADFIQPTKEIAVGTPCLASEVGAMAKQIDDGTIYSLTVSQVECEHNPLCPASTSGYCYMPINTITIVYTPNSSGTFTCPPGLFVDMSSIKFTKPNKPTPSTCQQFGWLPWKVQCHMDDCFFEQQNNCGIEEGKDLLAGITGIQGATFYQSFTTTGYSFHQGCPDGCMNIPTWLPGGYDTINAYACTNDLSRASLIITVN